MPRAAVLVGRGRPLELHEVEVDRPHAGEVAVRMAAAGVCHTDLSVQDGTVFCPLPMVLGHEGAGVVEVVGEGVDGLAPGDHVVVGWVAQCGSCYWCRREQAHLCSQANAALTSGVLNDGNPRVTWNGAPVFQLAGTGTFCEQAVVSADAVVKVPDDFDLRLAALLGCAVLTGVGAALNTARIRQGDTVAVVGCGGVGLNVVQGASLAGAGAVVAVDVNPHKLDLAARFGATAGVDAARSNAVAAVMDLTDQRGADVVFEVVGTGPTIDQAVSMTRRGGHTVLVGIPAMDVVVTVPAFLGMVLQEKTVQGCWYGSSDVRRDIPRLLDLHRRGELELSALISAEVALEQVGEALEALRAGEVARSIVVY